VALMLFLVGIAINLVLGHPILLKSDPGRLRH
jgi:hypothetical protein